MLKTQICVTRPQCVKCLNLHGDYVEKQFNPLNADLNLICHLLALLRAHPILHVSRRRVNVGTSTLQNMYFFKFSKRSVHPTSSYMLDALPLFPCKSSTNLIFLLCDLVLVPLVTVIPISLPYILLGTAIYLRKGVYHDCKFCDLTF